MDLTIFSLFTLAIQTLFSTEVLTKKQKEHFVSIAFVILSQANKYHSALSKLKKEDILNLTFESSFKVKIKVFESYKDFGKVTGHWTIFPLLKRLSKLENDWYFFLEDHTSINLQLALKVLSTFSSNEELFAGYALHDSEPSIIHHFAFNNTLPLLYPHFSAGFILSLPLLRKLTKKCEDCNFSIDPKYELAKYILEQTNVSLMHRAEFCLRPERDKCATWIDHSFLNCSSKVPASSVQVAVKTCKKFHSTRVPVVESTWLKDAGQNVLFFSDEDNSAVPTIQLPVPNVEKGHCEKTLSILRYYVEQNISMDWLVLVDDDTLINLDRLRKLLSCYDPIEDVVVGERYGFAIAADYGYDYPTGGSGTVFSRSVVRQLVFSCQCLSIDQPDDMTLGRCLQSLDISVTHSPLFHQARPSDYSKDFLSSWKHISFHKHWMIDPYQVYELWLKDERSNVTKHSEL